MALFALTRSPFYNFLQHFSGRCLQKHVFGNISVGVNFEEAGSCQQSRSALYFPSTFREVLFSGRSHVINLIVRLMVVYGRLNCEAGRYGPISRTVTSSAVFFLAKKTNSLRLRQLKSTGKDSARICRRLSSSARVLVLQVRPAPWSPSTRNYL